MMVFRRKQGIYRKLDKTIRKGGQGMKRDRPPEDEEEEEEPEPK